MIPPKYKFYCGKASTLNMTKGKHFIPSTGEEAEENLNFISSNKMFVDTNTIYINYSPSNNVVTGPLGVSLREELLNIYMYDKNGAFINRIEIKESKVYTLNENTDSIALEFYGLTQAIIDVHDSFVKSGFSEIYEIHNINPHYKELSKKYSKESQQEFFRISLDGQITLIGDDYEYVYNSNINSTFIFLIEKLNATSNEWYEYFKGQFNKLDCRFFNDKKKCEPKLVPLDKYTNIMNKYENTYDLIKLAPAITKIDLFKRSLLQVYVRGANTITNYFGGTYWEADVNEAIDSHQDLKNKYCFAYIRAGNEFYVKNAGIQEVNGVYAGTNGVWNQWNGYTCFHDTTERLDLAYIYIKRNSDNKILYKSEIEYMYTEENNDYIGREDIKMINVEDSNDTFVIESPFVYHIYMRLLCDVESIKDSTGIKQTYELPQDDFVTDNRNYKRCIGIETGSFFCTSRAVDKPTKYGMNDYGKYFTNQFLPGSLGLSRPLPISRNSWANASLWYVYGNEYPMFEEQLRKKFTLKDSYSIAAVIKAFLNKIDPTITHESTAEYSKFLYDTTNPLFANRFYVFLTQKTNILKGQYDQAAQTAEVTFEDIMKMLRDCFRCYWYIENNKFKIEHISYFMNGGSYSSDANIQLDFTKLIDAYNKKHVQYFQADTEFDKSELNNRYEFSWMDDVTELFGQVTIDVNAKYVQQDKKEDVNVNKFSSDVDFMMFNPSNFSNDGFALMCAIKNDNGSYELPIITSFLIDENGNNYKFISQNWYASWAYLANSFYMYDMPAYNVEINVLDNVHVSRIKRCMQHKIEFITAEDLDELKLINTSFGNGKIDNYSVNLNTRLAKVNLLYEPR